MARPSEPRTTDDTREQHGEGARPVAVEVHDLSKIYEFGEVEVPALVGVDLVIQEGSFVVLLGPSGSGKSTLLNLVGLLDTPTSGRVILHGRDATGSTDVERTELRRRQVSFIFQSFNLFPGLTALENVELGADIAGRKDAVELARSILSDVALADRMDHFPHQLSGGEQQRVGIARALASGNPILLADEPTGELDAETGDQIVELLRAQVASGRTAIVVTHNRDIALEADRVIELKSGRVVSDRLQPGGSGAPGLLDPQQGTTG